MNTPQTTDRPPDIQLAMRHIAAFAVLLCGTQAHATAGVWCVADDTAVKFSLQAAYGRSIGSSVANFGGELEIRLKGVPETARKITLESRNLSQNWYHDRDIRLMAQWLKDGDGPSPEVVLIVETRRAKAEGSSYRGRYMLKIYAPDSADGRPREAHGRVTCSAD
jgi:hypothetical protein